MAKAPTALQRMESIEKRLTAIERRLKAIEGIEGDTVALDILRDAAPSLGGMMPKILKAHGIEPTAIKGKHGKHYGGE